MVRAMGLGSPPTARGGSAGGGRDSLGPRAASGQLPDRDLSDRCVVPTSAVGRETALGGDAAARAEGAGAGTDPGVALCLQRYVEALPERYRERSRASVARVGSFPYHHPLEPGGGSGAPRREHAPAGAQPAASAEAQAHALAAAAPGQPGPWTGPTKTGRLTGQQTGHGSRLGVKGSLLPLLALPIGNLGGSFS